MSKTDTAKGKIALWYFCARTR